MVASLVLTTTAQDADAKKTYAYIGAIPNPAGVGQEVLLHVGITQELQSVEMAGKICQSQLSILKAQLSKPKTTSKPMQQVEPEGLLPLKKREYTTFSLTSLNKLQQQRRREEACSQATSQRVR
jgi:hypothetical protein